MLTQALTWVQIFPLAAAMLFFLVGTTYFWFRAVGAPAPISVVAAPAVTSVVVLVLSIAYYRLGIFWSGARVLPTLALIGAAGAIVFVRGRPKTRRSAGRWVDRPFLTPSYITAAALAVLLATLPFMFAGPATNPVQQWDPSFHMNGIWGMTQLGVGAPGEGLAHNYGGRAPSGYPIGWHSFTALFATGPTAVQTANASSVALIILWVVAVSVYAYTLYPNRTAAVAATVLAGTALGMPADALGAYSQWPNAMSIAYLPGAAALAVITGRQWVARISRTEKPGAKPAALQLVAWSTLTLLAVYGGILAHQVFAFNIAVLLAPAVVAGAAKITRAAISQRRPVWVIAPTLVIIGLAATVVYVLNLRALESMRSYPRSGVSLQAGLSQALLPIPPFPNLLGMHLYAAVVAALAAVGVLWIVLTLVLKRKTAELGEATQSRQTTDLQISRPAVWPIWSAAAFAALVFFAYGPDWPIRTWVVGAWFNDGRRIMEPQSVAVVPLAALGFAWIVTALNVWLDADLQRTLGWLLGGILVMGTVFGALDARIAATRTVLDPNALGKPGMATEGVLDMMNQLPDLLDEDAVVLGDPQAGAMYSQMIGQRWAYFPQLSYLNADRDAQAMLVHRFKHVATDPAVCQVVTDQGITHFFESPDGQYYGRYRSDRSPGLYNVDTSVGFELVAEGDGAGLYLITACD